MNAKPTIVHVIDSLVRGGAETLLVNLLEELNRHYTIILVTLLPDTDFDESKTICTHRYCLHYKGPRSIIPCAIRLRRIITKHNPSLVRAQLFYSSLIARVATPKKIPLFFSIHTNMSRDAYTKNRLALVMEKLTYHKTHHLIGVSNDALEDFNKYVGIKGPNYTLYNFINSLYFDKARVFSSAGHMNLKMVAVGNLKPVKNYGYLIHAFEQLKESGITLDIYGDGPLRSTLQDAITKSGVPITLKGSNEEIYNVLPAYDLYVMPSLYEGFGIAPVEAMAIGLPLLLSDIPVLREVVHGNALFFNPNRPESFVSLIHRIIEGAFDLAALSATGIRIATGNYQKKDYITKLNAIYGQALHSSNTPRAK